MRVCCPHCRNPIELIDDVPLNELTCPSCGSSFSPTASDTTAAYRGDSKTVIGHFELLQHIGAGRFGNVWQARDTHLDRTVAVKLPRREQLDETETELFFREARAAAQLRHPNIVPVHEVGREDGTIYIVSDYVAGANLKEWLTSKRLAVQETAELCIKLAEALHHAHEAGVVHRDLKPSNIMMDFGGEPHVMDFGLAKRDAGEITMTMQGQILGTPAYMSPEQARGEGHHADRRSDVYSLGVILYELLTGEQPFRGESRMLIVQIIQDEPPSPRRLNNRVPRDLETICLKCLEKESNRRYATARFLADDLKRFVRGEAIHARPVRRIERAWRWAKRNRGIATMAAAVFGLLFITALIAIHSAIRIKQSQTAALEAQRDRALSQIDALLDATPSAVPTILESLEPFRDWVNPRLYELSEQNLPPQKMRRVHLALLRIDAGYADELSKQMLDARPDEFLLIRDSLLPHKSALTAQLWTITEDASASQLQRFRAACALAAYAPADPRWRTIAGDVAVQLVRENPLFLTHWKEALRPVSAVLHRPLVSLARDADRSETARLIATNTLAEYASDDPEALSKLVVTAEFEQYHIFLEKLRAHGANAIASLKAELERKPQRYWPGDEPTIDVPPLPSGGRARIASYSGRVAERFAICHSVPLDHLADLCRQLRPYGYEPFRVRPYLTGGRVHAAVIWHRNMLDAEASALAIGLSAEALSEQDTRRREERLVPIDVAAYPQPTADGSGAIRFCAVWSKANDNDRRMLLAAPQAEANDLIKMLQNQGFGIETLQTLLGSDGTLSVSAVLSRGQHGELTTLRDQARMHEGGPLLDRVHRDISFRRKTPVIDNGAVLADASEVLEQHPGDHDARKRRIDAAFYLGRNQLVLDDVNFLESNEAIFPDVYRYRAIASARLGNEQDARQDLLKLSIRTFNDEDAQKRKLGTAAIVGAYLGDDVETILSRIEEIVEEEPDRELVYDAAAAYATLSRRATEREMAERYASRALELLRRFSADLAPLSDRLNAPTEFADLKKTPEAKRLVEGFRWEYDAVWYQTLPGFESQELRALTPQEHLQRAQALARQGYRPVAISVADISASDIADDAAQVVASVWWRPVVTADEKSRLARQKANAAAALLNLGHSDPVWPLLEHHPDPTVQSHLTHRLSPLGVDPQVLVDRLLHETETSVRRALILCLGDFDVSSFSDDSRDALIAEVQRLYRSDPDPGSHSAAGWLMRTWGRGGDIEALDTELASAASSRGRRWYVAANGHTMAVVPGPEEFLMGSPPQEPGRSLNESRHRKQINRTFSVSTTEVTVAQFRKFLESNPEIVLIHGFDSRNKAAEKPVHGLNWITAAAYCRWLSEQEGLAEDEMCYSAISPDGVTVAEDYLSRSGYRLPTEAEWEFVCRAGTTSSHSYGDSPDLLDRYAHHRYSSQLKQWPPGILRPNPAGLFDTLGNVSEFCHAAFAPYPMDHSDRRFPDSPTLTDFNAQTEVAVRGGGATSLPMELRSAARQSGHAATWSGGTGFRVACTLPPFRMSPQQLHLASALELKLGGWGTEFVIKDIEGQVRVTPSRGVSPEVLKVAPLGSDPTEFSFVLQRMDRNASRVFAGILSSPWKIRYYAYRWEQDDWAAVQDGRALHEERVTRLDFAWDADETPHAMVPSSDYALAATTELHLSGGTYTVETKANDGIRVLLDGRTIIDEWEPRLLDLQDRVEAHIDEGKHTLCVEYFRAGGPGMLHVQMVRMD